jgi:hypothetical protein
MGSILICCESSGIVREAFREKGIDAYSCDILPSEDDSPYHIQGDCLEIMQSRDWGGFGFHPPCTYLCVSGIQWNNRGRGWENTEKAVTFVKAIVELAGDKPYYLENPVSVLSTKLRKPDQVIQPYQFGHNVSKRTCLWLQKLPLLVPTEYIEPERIMYKGRPAKRWANQCPCGADKHSPNKDRGRNRSRTFLGIADAMADQWSQYLI